MFSKNACFLLGAATRNPYIVFAPVVWLHVTEIGVYLLEYETISFKILRDLGMSDKV